jgi:hypothetical protein
MKRMMLLLALAIVLVAITASAATTTQKFTTGWDNFGEPLNFTKSNVKWSVSATRKLTVTYTLVGATPTSSIRAASTPFAARFLQRLANFPRTLAAVPASPLDRE